MWLVDISWRFIYPCLIKLVLCLLLVYRRKFIHFPICQNHSNNTWCTASRFLSFFLFFRPTQGFFLHIWRGHHYQWRAANFDLYSALMAIQHPRNPSALFNLVSHKIHLVNSNFTLSKVPNLFYHIIAYNKTKFKKFRVQIFCIEIFCSHVLLEYIM